MGKIRSAAWIVAGITFLAGCSSSGQSAAAASPATDAAPSTATDAGTDGASATSGGDGGPLADGARGGESGGPNADGGTGNDGGGIQVSGKTLLRDGQPWTPKGLSMIGALTAGSAVTAYAHWGMPEMVAAKSFGADAMRLQVSQPVLDPQSASYSAAYLTQIEAMVTLAQSYGLAVILSMQDQSLAGGNADPLPTASTVRAWAALAPIFATDDLVIYELYNEPQNTADTAGWAAWQNGGAGTVGHQQLLDGVRASGAQNFILADGAQHAEVLTGVPPLNDPLTKLGYAAHPYYLDSINTDPSAWDQRFGDLSSQFPVVVTEWDNDSSSSNCEADAPTLVPEFITYLKQHNIGVFGWAFDLPGTLVQDWTWAPTTFNNYNCSVAGGGAGELLHEAFTM